MNFKLILIGLLLVLFSTQAFALTTNDSNYSSGVYNGGFENAPVYVADTNTNGRWIDGTQTGSTTDTNYGWYVAGTFSGGFFVDFNSITKKSGNYSMELKNNGSNVQVRNIAYTSPLILNNNFNLIKIKPLTKYKLSAWIKSDNASSNACYFQFPQRTILNATATGTISSSKLSGTTDWTYTSIELTSNANSYYTFIVLYNDYSDSNGSCFFDDVRLEEVGSTNLSGQVSGRPSILVTGVSDFNAIDQADTNNSNTMGFGTTNTQAISFQFTPTQNRFSGFVFQRAQNTGTYTGNVTITLEKDDGSNNPDGNVLASHYFTNAQWEALNPNVDQTVYLPYIIDANGTNKYHVKFYSDTSDGSNYTRLRVDTRTGYSGGVLRTMSDANVWSSHTSDGYFKTLFEKQSSAFDLNVCSSGDSVCESKTYDIDFLEDGETFTINPSDAPLFYSGDNNVYFMMHSDSDYNNKTPSMTAKLTYTFDKPTTTFSSSQIAGTTDQNITLTCTDNNTGCYRINYKIDNNIWLFNYNPTYFSNYDATEYTHDFSTQPFLSWDSPTLVNTYYIKDNQSNKIISVKNSIKQSCPGWETMHSMYKYYYIDGTTEDSNINTGQTDSYVTKSYSLPSYDKDINKIELYIWAGGVYSYQSTMYWKDSNITYFDKNIQNPTTILFSGAGDHNIQYYSTDNSDNNETIKTSYFTTYGLGKFTFYDEDSLNLLNSINYTITPSINGVSSGTTDGNTLDLNLQGITTGTYTFTFTKTGYSTRSYAIDLTQYSEIDINFALIPESLSKEVQFRFYKPDQTTSYNNVYITASKNPQGFVLSRLKTDSTGLVTFNLDQNSTGITFDMNNGENTYNSVVLTINKPKDEQTLIDINANWSYDISGLASYTDSNVTTATKVFAIYSNTVNTYSVLIGSTSTVPTYTTRKYDIQVFGDTNTYTLQPYLINTTDSIQTTIFTINPYTNQAISDVTIKIYRTLPLTGRTLIEQTRTDSKGQSIVYLVLNQTYSFEISVGTTTIRTETYTITGTSSTIYFKVDPGYDLSTTPMQTSIYSFWTPGKSSLNKADRNISANVIYGTNRNSVTVSSIILNCYNNLDLNQVLLFQDSFSSPTMNFIQTYDFNLTTKTLNSVTFDTNYSITCNIYTTLSDGNLIVSKQTYTMNNDDPQTNLGMDLRPFFGCSSTTDPNLPCPSMILAAVFITMMVITGIMIESGFTQPEFAGILFLIGLGFFTFFTWIPPVLYVIMLVIGLLIYVALGVRRI